MVKQIPNLVIDIDRGVVVSGITSDFILREDLYFKASNGQMYLAAFTAPNTPANRLLIEAATAERKQLKERIDRVGYALIDAIRESRNEEILNA